MDRMTAEDVIDALDLSPHPAEGGFFRETYRAAEAYVGRNPRLSSRNVSTAIYYLLTETSFSAVHRFPADEVFHFYLGDPVEMLNLHADGSSRIVRLGTDLARGQRPQVVVAGEVWQGCRLVPGGSFALLGTTVAPSFEYEDFELGVRDDLIQAHPDQAELIRALTAD